VKPVSIGSDGMTDALVCDDLTLARQKIVGSFILIAEDLSYNQQVLKELVRQLQCDCYVVSNGLDLVEEYKKRHHEFTAILTDIDMPKMDGI